MADPVAGDQGPHDRSSASGDGRAGPGAAFRDRTAETRSAAASLAEQARARLAGLVDEQRAAGADRISGVAQAAQSAAADLDRSSPELARLVRSAADGVDRVAEDLRAGDFNRIIANVASFSRQQPVAFVGGTILVGFLLARFFKSDAASDSEARSLRVDHA